MNYLEHTYFLDHRHDAVQRLVADYKSDTANKKDQAITLYLKIRDGWRYNPYKISLDRETYRASSIALKTEGHCIEKAILLVAGLRALEIPAKLQLAKVKNHIGVGRLIEKFGTNELTPHGMVNIYLNGKWLKVSPAFNRQLCEKCEVDPLDFDGENDSVFQQFNRQGNSFMEYLEDYGSFEDVPIDFIFNNFREHYPGICERNEGNQEIFL
jgi:transglutaminase-like putative cysteine protease